MTILIRNWHHILPYYQGGVVTIGNFDGVHQGHQALLLNIKQRAQSLQVPSIVILFEPQPFEFFSKKNSGARLTRFREKFHALQKERVDAVLLLKFDKVLAELPAEDFIRNILVSGLKIKYLVIGDDFRFGYQRQGDFQLLKDSGSAFGFSVEAMPTFTIENQRVSSTWVRKALANDDLTLAELLLGRPYTMMGRIIHGNKLGAILGFPTANIDLHRCVTPIHGIFAVRLYGIGKSVLPGVANVGIRPTIGGTRTLLEVYLFNFNQDIYGQYVTVEFCYKLRNEECYDNLDSLKTAIAHDVEEAQDYFKKRGGL